MKTSFCPCLFLVAIYSSLLAAVDGSSSSGHFQDPPSPPRDLRWSVVGAMDPNREYRVFWSASSYTGGLPVNYSIKLCVNDSNGPNNGACNWSSNPDCRPANVLSTKRDFFCVLLGQDFISPLKKFCNYIILVVAETVVGSTTSWRYLPYIPTYSATPFPPLNFTVETTNKANELKVKWTARSPWKYTQTEYTILYHAKNEMENKTKVVKKITELTQLMQLVPFTEYYIYIMVRFVSEEGERSAPSEVLGPRIAKTPAGDPDTPSKVIKDLSVNFPGNPALRDVTVEWEMAVNSSWHGTPGKYLVYCNHHVLSLGSLPNCKYYVDATSTRTVLQDLKSADKYNVYIKMCNKEGKCSPASEPYIIKELQGNVTSSKNGGELSSTQIALIAVPVVVGCITVLVAVYFIRKWLRGKVHNVLHVRNLRDRVQLHPPVPVMYDYADPLATNDYDRLNLNESQV